MKEEEKKPILLDIGCGEKKDPDWIGIDKYKSSVTDIVLDLDNPKMKLPFENDSVSEIKASHVLEHINGLFHLMNEFWRVLVFNGHLNVVVPLAPSRAAFDDPTHVRFFTKATFHYFTSTPPGAYENPEIKGLWKILKNDWSPKFFEEGDRLAELDVRELHVFLQPEKAPPEFWKPEMDEKK